jgi:hypothetical protein
MASVTSDQVLSLCSGELLCQPFPREDQEANPVYPPTCLLLPREKKSCPGASWEEGVVWPQLELAAQPQQSCNGGQRPLGD